jgi:oligoendopeptidase F
MISEVGMKGSRLLAAVAAVAALALVVSSLAPRVARGQPPPAPSPADSAGRYHFDLARDYFSSPEVEVAARAHLHQRVTALRTAGEHLTTSPAALLRALLLADSVRMESKRHTIYLYLLTQLNTLDEASAQAQSTLEAELDAATSVIDNGLLKLDDATLAIWIRTLPALETYRFAIESVRRMRKHTLPAAQEGIALGLTPIAEDWPMSLYHRLIARTDFGTIQTPSGELRVLRDRGAIAGLPDTALRAEGIRRLWAGYAQHRDLYAMALTGTVRAKNGLARIRGYRDAPDEAYQKAYLSAEEVHALLDRVRPAARVYLSFQRASARIASEPRPAPLAGGRTPIKFTMSQAVEEIRSALAPLGNDEYAGELAALLDSTSGRVDVAGGANRAGGGGANGYPGIPSAIYLEHFGESYPDLSRLAHESAHAVENQLVHLHRVPAVYARGAPYLSEAYALFTELVVANALYEKVTTPRLKRFYLGQFLNKAMEVFHGAQDADLEQSIYDGADAGGGLIGADGLDSLTRRVDTAYSIYGETAPEVRARWITARLLYEDPLYLFNYMYSGLLSLKLFESYQRDPAAFGARYVALLSSGYRAAPAVAVRQAFGIDLDDPHLLDEATAFLESRLRLYEAELPTR